MVKAGRTVGVEFRLDVGERVCGARKLGGRVARRRGCFATGDAEGGEGAGGEPAEPGECAVRGVRGLGAEEGDEVGQILGGSGVHVVVVVVVVVVIGHGCDGLGVGWTPGPLGVAVAFRGGQRRVVVDPVVEHADGPGAAWVVLLVRAAVAADHHEPNAEGLRHQTGGVVEEGRVPQVHVPQGVGDEIADPVPTYGVQPRAGQGPPRVAGLKDPAPCRLGGRAVLGESFLEPRPQDLAPGRVHEPVPIGSRGVGGVGPVAGQQGTYRRPGQVGEDTAVGGVGPAAQLCPVHGVGEPLLDRRQHRSGQTGQRAAHDPAQLGGAEVAGQLLQGVMPVEERVLRGAGERVGRPVP